MARVPMPAGVAARISELAIRPVHPAQIVQRSPFTLQQQVLERGGGTWAGTVTFAAAGLDGAAAAAEVEGFLASLNGRANVFELPLGRPTIPLAEDGVRNVTVIGGGLTGGVEHTLSGTITATIGTYLRVDQRLFCVTAIAGVVVTLEPQIQLDVLDLIDRATTVRARASSDIGMSVRQPGKFGPWVLQWEEAT